jgi:hypothetical protein
MKVDTELQIAGGMEWGKWLSIVGRGSTTGYHWRQEGPNGEPPRIKTCNIDGKHYVRAEASKHFWDLAEAGAFAKKPVVPTKPPSKNKKAKKPNVNGGSEDAKSA